MAEAGADQTISGTATGADGQVVTVTLTPVSGAPVVLTSAPVAGGAWSVPVTSAHLQALAQGNVGISASVSDAAGNPATPATASFAVDTVAPTISIATVATDGVINATEQGAGITVTGTTNAEVGQVVTILIDGVATGTTATVQAGGSFSVSVAAGDLAALANGSTPAFTASVSDLAGNTTTSGAVNVPVNTTPPALALVTVAGDGIVNIAEKAAGFTANGTTNAEDGQVVSVTLTSGAFNTTATATANGGAFTVSFTPAALAALPDGPANIAATVTNQIGNTATTAPTAVTVDLVAPTLAIDDPLAGNNIFSKLNEANGLDVTGTTTGVEVGQIVTVTYNGVDYPTAPLVGSTWSVTIPAAAFAGIATGQSITGITARVSDAAGNPSTVQTAQTLGVDLTGPSISINAVATDDIINALESGSDLVVTGVASGADNQVATIEIRDASDAVLFTATPTVTAGTGVWTITIPQVDVAALADGATFTVRATVSDFEGIPAVPATRSFTTDYTAPSVTITTPIAGDDVINIAEAGGTLTIAGTTTGAQDGQLVSLTLGAGGPVVTAPVAGNAWSVTLTQPQVATLAASAAEGTNLPLSATVTDAAGNISTAVVVNVTADLTAPTIALNALPFGPSLNAVEDDSAQTISGTAVGADGQVVTVTLTPESGAPVVLTSAAIVGGTWSVSATALQLQGLAEGTVTISAAVSDAPGNPATPATTTFVKDTVAPTIALDALPFGPSLNAVEDDSAQTISGTAVGADGQTVTVTLTPESGAPVVLTSAAIAGGTWSVSATALQLQGLAEGTVTISAAVSDAAGNPATPATTTFVKDTVAPTIALDALPFGPSLNAVEDDSAQTISGTAVGADGQVVTVTLTPESGAPVVLTSAAIAGGTWSVSATALQLQGLAEGTVTISGAVSDAAGNPATPATTTFVKDTVPPTIALDALPFGPSLNAVEDDSAQTISGTAVGADGQTVTVTLTPESGAPVVLTSAAIAGGTWSVSATALQLQGLAEGTVTISAAVSDAAGNPATPATTTFVKDTVAPTIALDALPFGPSLNAVEDDSAQTISGTAVGADGQVVTVTLTPESGAPVVLTSAAIAGGTWSVSATALQLQGLAEGTVTISAAVSDAAGNPATPATTTFVKDTVPPTIALDALPFGPSLNAVEDDSAQTISGTAVGADGQVVTVTLTPESGAPVVLTSAAIAGGTWSVSATNLQLQGLAEGTVTISAAVSDAAGNLATPATTTFVKDSIAPDLAITSVQSGGVDVGAFLNIAERDGGVTISGTTDAESTQSVTVTITAAGPVTFNTTVPVTNGTWTATFDAATLAPLPDGAVITATATVSDAAGNPATPAVITTTSDFTPPTVSIDSHAVDGLVTGSSTGLAAGATVNLNVGSESYTTTVNGTGAWQVQIPRAAGANSFQGLGQVFNQSLTSTATVADAAGNPGSATREVTIYKEPGYFIAESARTGSSATYQLFGNDTRTSEQVDLVINTALVSYVDNPSSYTLRNDIVGFLSDVVPQTVNSESVLRISLTMDTTSPNYPQPSDVPLVSLNLNFVGGDSDVAAYYRLRTASADTYGGDSESWIGSSAVDTINVGAIASAVRGMGGADVINLSAGGENIVLFETTQALNGNDTIIGFQTGPEAKLPDTIGFAGLTNADLRGTGADAQQLAAGGTIGANTGFVILTTAIADLSSATLETTAEGLFGETGGDVLYLLASDGTNSALARVSYADVDDANVEVLGTFLGLANAGQVGTDQIFGFNDL
jgi:hypothetical protein